MHISICMYPKKVLIKIHKVQAMQCIFIIYMYNSIMFRICFCTYIFAFFFLFMRSDYDNASAEIHIKISRLCLLHKQVTRFPVKM